MYSSISAGESNSFCTYSTRSISSFIPVTTASASMPIDPSSGLRLHDQRKFHIVRVVDVSAVRGGEERRTDIVEREHLLGGGFVLR